LCIRDPGQREKQQRDDGNRSVKSDIATLVRQFPSRHESITTDERKHRRQLKLEAHFSLVMTI
jgi:hypothetical protein